MDIPETKSMTIRWPMDLYRRISGLAKAQGRSFYRQLLFIVAAYLDEHEARHDAEQDSPNSLGAVMAPLKERGYKRVNDPRKDRKALPVSERGAK